jgi:hypothetical protein
MCCDNENQMTESMVVDFDAVSLNPSNMIRLYVLEGIPLMMKEEMLNVDYLTRHLFEDDQL